MPDYIYLLHPFRHGLYDNPRPEEQAILAEQESHLKRAQELGIVRLTGLCLDDTFAFVIFQAEDEQAACEFMFHDPAVRANLMAAELHPLQLSPRII
ncbi:MAG: YciI family protein [Anaerolineales bacterium]|nr:YciI family protein [Anaerolineales bacterium]MCX7609847.1 YciI family protein [Anaerolineales bacterium]MDW8227320.1 hypothetical protein [Anaerolineales bacterium]